MLKFSIIKTICVCTLFVCLLHPIHAFSTTQVKQDSSLLYEAYEWANKAREIQYSNPDLAKQYYSKAKELIAPDIAANRIIYVSPTLDLANIYLRQQRWDSVRILCDEVKDLIQKDLKPIESQVQHLNLEASYAQYNTSAEDAIDKFLEIAAIAKKHPEHEASDFWLMQAYNNLGNTYRNIGKYDDAIEAFELALEHAPEGNEKGIILNNIGAVYMNLHLNEKAMTYFERAKKIRLEHKDMNGVLYSLSYILDVHDALGDKTKAMEVAQEAYQIASTEENAYFQVELATRIAEMFIDDNKLDQAEQQLGEIKHIIQQDIIQGGSLFYYRSIEAFIALQKQEFKKAATLYDQLEADIKITDSNTYLTDIAKHQFLVHNELGDKAAAKHYFQLYDSLAIQGFKAENTDKLAAIEADLVNAENENEILRLEKDKTVLAHQAQQNRTIAFSVGILALLAIIFYFNSRKKNKTINTQKEELELLNRTKDQIFAIIGHDLRKPALAFKGITKKVNYLLQKQDYQRLNVLGQAIENDAIALNQLTNNLLSWALTQKNIMPYKPSYFKLKDRVNEELQLFKQQINEKNISTHVDIADDLEVYADADAFSTIIRNLLDNAVKYTPEQGQINISSAVAKTGRVNIQIHDTGVGMSEEQLKNIFLLEKGKSSQGTQGEKGTGLGMHLVNELVKLNKAQIDVASAIGNGTRIELSFPAS